MFDKTRFMRRIEKIVEAAGELEEFNTSPEYHLRLEHEPWMPLVIEAFNSDGIGKRNISVAHYFEQNGDLVADPDVLVDEYGYPIYLQQVPIRNSGFTQVRVIRDGKEMVNLRAKADVLSFLNMWNNNLSHQGWEKTAKEYAKNKKNGGQQKLATA